MKDTDCGRECLVMEIRVKARQVRRHHQPLIRDHPVGKATYIKIGVRLERHFSSAARDKKFTQTMIVVNAIRINENLLYAWQLIQRNFATNTGINRNFTPAIDGKTL